MNHPQITDEITEMNHPRITHEITESSEAAGLRRVAPSQAHLSHVDSVGEQGWEERTGELYF